MTAFRDFASEGADQCIPQGFLWDYLGRDLKDRGAKAAAWKQSRSVVSRPCFLAADEFHEPLAKGAGRWMNEKRSFGSECRDT